MNEEIRNEKKSTNLFLFQKQKKWGFGGVAAATPPNRPRRCILTDYFNN